MLSLRPSRLASNSTSKKVPGVKARRHVVVMAKRSGESLVKFPYTYRQVTSQSQESVRQALADGHQLLEVEFPTLGLDSVPGDAEGCNEMSESAVLLRQFCTMFENSGNAQNVRVYFPGL